MARNASLFEFTGKVGGLIGYKRNGKYFIRSMPETVRQTQSTRHAAKWFGAASRKGALIRSAVMPDLDIHCDGGMVNQLNRTIVKAGRNNHAGLAGFRFNKHTGVNDLFSVSPTFTQDGRLHIPAQELAPPAGCIRMEVKLIGTRIDFPTQQVTGTDASVLYIDLEHPYTQFQEPILISMFPERHAAGHFAGENVPGRMRLPQPEVHCCRHYRSGRKQDAQCSSCTLQNLCYTIPGVASTNR